MTYKAAGGAGSYRPQKKSPHITFNPCEYCGDGDPSNPCRYRKGIEKGHDCVQRIDP